MQKSVTIYSKTGCPYCKVAKQWFDSKDLDYSEILLDTDQKRQAFYESVGNDVKTVPQIFIEDRRIGGYMELIRQESYVMFLLDSSKFLE